MGHFQTDWSAGNTGNIEFPIKQRMVEEEMPASPHSHGMGTLYETMHARAMAPAVTPLDGPLLPLSPALDFIHRRIMPRIFKNPLSRFFLSYFNLIH